MKIPESAPSKVVRGMTILKMSYPSLFDNESPLPIALGVKERILEEQPVSKSAIRRAIQFYCNNISYLKSFKSNTHRYNLDGSVATKLTDEDKSYAANKIVEIRAMLKCNKTKKTVLT